MADCMMFPGDWGEFLKDYSFKDKEEVYTNGTVLIPVFRVEQMVEHYFGGKWIPVSERLPDKMMQCVCQYVFGDNTEYPFYVVMWYFANDKVPHFQNEGSMGLRVTHWMPLPEPPED